MRRLQTREPHASTQEPLRIPETKPPTSDLHPVSSPLPGNGASFQRQRYPRNGLGNNRRRWVSSNGSISCRNVLAVSELSCSGICMTTTGPLINIFPPLRILTTFLNLTTHISCHNSV